MSVPVRSRRRAMREPSEWEPCSAPFLDLIGLYSYRLVDQEAQLTRFRLNHVEFRALLTANNSFLTIVAELEESRLSDFLPHPAWVKKQVLRAAVDVHRMVKCIDAISDNRYPQLVERYQSIAGRTRRSGWRAFPPCPVVLGPGPFRDPGRARMAGGGEDGEPGGDPKRHRPAHAPGFAVTAEAYQSMIREHGFLPGPNGRLCPLSGDGSARRDEEMVDRIMSIPETIGRRSWMPMIGSPRLSDSPPAVAVRSSAIGEDSDYSFTGQFLTLLNVKREGLIEAYRKVVESLFSAEAVHYRQLHKLAASAMPVGFLFMVDAVASGVVYTADPSRPDARVILVHVVKGLGPSLVDGRTSPETIRVERDPELRIGPGPPPFRPPWWWPPRRGGVRDEPLSRELASTPA